MITAVDTNVLIDVLQGADFATASRGRLREASAAGAVVISDVVYTELASFVPSDADLQRFVAGTQIRVEASDSRALRIAGRAWRLYRLRRRDALSCPECGTEQRV